jgi:hypothetical protein
MGRHRTRMPALCAAPQASTRRCLGPSHRPLARQALALVTTVRPVVLGGVLGAAIPCITTFPCISLNHPTGIFSHAAVECTLGAAWVDDIYTCQGPHAEQPNKAIAPLSCLALSYSFPPTQRVRTCAHESSNSMFCFIGMHQSRDNRKQTASVRVSPCTSFRHVLSQ